MARSVAIIGAGQIGYGAWYCLGDMGHEASVLARSRPDWLTGFEHHFKPYEAGQDAAPEAEIVFDTIAFDAEDIDRYDPDRVGRLIVVSSASVYCDHKGRTLDEAAQHGFPEFDGPISESQSTVEPGSGTYSTRKRRMELRALELFGDRVTILRPCAIYGPYSRHPREWWFVKRLLDGRTQIPLAFEGASQFHTTNADLIGDFVVAVAERDLAGIFNLADATSPTVVEIGRSIAELLDRPVDFVPIAGPPVDNVGRAPWAVPRPFLVDGSKAAKAGQLARIQFDVEAEDTVRWLRDLNPSDWRTAFPQLAAYPWDLFDYKAEDRFFASL
ncbi:hypothetical protein [Erythrobacter sp. JK5]|uniref:hypothetical protein n=1 Tax=Erythrobacter sp. JK5 TaxID=2829500 RepID=UPI001BA4B0BF|nr:hypothetical protein [Erythrobacter sp. JK5]QUL38415.1 hypothetical protein KDC96_03085 [Erythrobacter sp. JK5]